MLCIGEKLNSYSDQYLEVEGNTKLCGEINIQGAKNSALVLMAASILSNEEINLYNFPNLTDIEVMKNILTSLGVSNTQNDNHMKIKAINLINRKLPKELVSELRASFTLIGALITRFNEVCIPLPGGCKIGSRPIDEHIKGLKKLGVSIQIKNQEVIAKTENQLNGAEISLDFPSVGATETLIMASVLAKGTTILKNAAREPEVQDLAIMLNKMGANISGTGTQEIIIEGVDSLSGCNHNVIPDRIEAGTFLIAAAATGSELKLNNVNHLHLKAVINKLELCGNKFEVSPHSLKIKPIDKNAVDVITAPYPGFPTDLQSPFMVLMSISNGISNITELMFENRLSHVSQLIKLGADIKVKDRTATINGVHNLRGNKILGSDLRSAAAMVIAGLIAKGNSTIEGLNHLDRGYENFEKKLNKLGAQIIRKDLITSKPKTIDNITPNKNIEKEISAA
tara:strand:- start:4181 stop:5542 length:1362 start_codon:yes stop_codon:yes gene_type:complete